MICGIKKSAGDVTSTFVKSREIFNRKHSERPHRKGGAAGCLLLQMLSPHWEQLEKDAGAQRERKKSQVDMSLKNREQTALI